jgi:hypothetical protein
MLRHLNRKQFIDRWWDATDLDAVAEFWLRLYEEAARSQGFGRTPIHETEIRLRGFPRPAANELLKELAARVAASDFPAPEADQPDPDTLSVASGVIRGDERPPVGLGLPVVSGGPFDGLLAEIRLRVIGDEGKALRRVDLESTLVLVGELRGGRFLLKGAWRTGSHGWEDEVCWAGGWPELDRWLAAFDEFRETDEVPASLAKKQFIARGADQAGALAVKMIHVPLGKPRLAGLLTRFAIFAVLFAALGLAGWWIVENRRWFLLILLLLASWPVGWLFVTLVRKEWNLWSKGFRQMHAAFTKVYSEPIRLAALTRAEVDARLDNPWERKYVGELEAAGFCHAGDMQVDPPVSGDNVYRVFYCPDGVSYLMVLFHLAGSAEREQPHRCWPAAVTWLAHTYYDDGGSATTITGRHVGFRKKRSGPEHLSRIIPEQDDPVAFARQHSAVARRFAEETGRRAIAQLTFDQIVRRQNERHEEERRLFVDNPYTWGDHVGWYLQRPRREYLG